MVGAVRGIDPETGHYFDDTKRYVDALGARRRRTSAGSSRATRAACTRASTQWRPERRAARTSDERRPASGASPWTPTGSPFHPNPSRPAFRRPAGAVDAHCHVFGPGDALPLCARAQVHARATRGKDQLFALRDFLGFDRNVIVQATCHGADNRALVDALRRRRRPRPRRRHRRPGVTRRGARGPATPPGCAAIRFNFVKRLVDADARRVLPRARSTRRRARLARRRLLRGRGPARALGPLHLAADDRRRRPHGSARRDEARRRPGVRALPAADARERERLVQGQLPRAAVGHRAAGLRRRRALRAPHRRDVPRPRPLGHGLAAPEPDVAHARRRAARRLHPAASHRTDRPAATAAGRQPHPPVLGSTGDRHGTSTSPSTTSPARPSSTPTRRARATT